MAAWLPSKSLRPDAVLLALAMPRRHQLAAALTAKPGATSRSTLSESDSNDESAAGQDRTALALERVGVPGFWDVSTERRHSMLMPE